MFAELKMSRFSLGDLRMIRSDVQEIKREATLRWFGKVQEGECLYQLKEWGRKREEEVYGFGKGGRLPFDILHLRNT